MIRDSQNSGRIPRATATFLSAVLLAFALAAVVPSVFARIHNSAHADEQPDLRAYVGTWKATFQGKDFAILVLREDNHGSLEGSLNNFEIAVDKQGNLADGTHIDIGVSPLISPRFKNGALIFTVAQKDAYAQTTDWSFVVKNKREGELTENLENQLEAPMSMIVNPIPMHRVAAH
ncbi:MAG: hypothetical protein WBQ34_04950 [Candidatus Acidiferrales bacterium]